MNEDLPKSPTPSMDAVIAPTLEHVEARQAAIDAERKAYIETLGEEDKKRFVAMEKAVEILATEKIPFFLWAKPNPKELEGAGIWQYQKTTYLDPFCKEGAKEHANFSWQVMWAAIKFFAQNGSFFIPVYTPSRELVGFEGPKSFFKDGENKS